MQQPDIMLNQCTTRILLTKPEAEGLVALGLIKDLAVLQAAPVAHHHLLAWLGQLAIRLAHRQPLQLEPILPPLNAALLGRCIT